MALFLMAVKAMMHATKSVQTKFWLLNPLSANINIHVPISGLLIFLMELVRSICQNIKTFCL